MTNSTLDPNLIGGSDRRLGIGHDNDALGPGDTSDSGSDVCGLTPPGVDTDSHGTGERSSVDTSNGRQNNDIGTDHIHSYVGNDALAGEDEIDPEAEVEMEAAARTDDEALNDELLDLEDEEAEDSED